MAASSQTLWDIEPHTVAKHQLLEHYLKAWYPILGSTEGRIVFLDGFAGPGIYSGGEPGSPIIAIRTLLNHTAFSRLRNSCEFVFHFIEKEPDRLAMLKRELNNLGSLPDEVTVHTHLDEFHNIVGELTDSLESRNQRLAPTLAFVDPFGVSGVPMELISKFLDSPKCELFLILMADHLNRFLKVGSMRDARDELFGTNDFTAIESASPKQCIPMLVELYERQLVRTAKFNYTRDFQMKRRDGHDAYYVVYATRSERGIQKFKEAMWKVDPGEGRRFSDRNWNQASLFVKDNVDTQPASRSSHGRVRRSNYHDRGNRAIHKPRDALSDISSQEEDPNSNGSQQRHTDCGCAAQTSKGSVRAGNQDNVSSLPWHLIPCPSVETSARGFLTYATH